MAGAPRCWICMGTGVMLAGLRRGQPCQGPHCPYKAPAQEKKRQEAEARRPKITEESR